MPQLHYNITYIVVLIPLMGFSRQSWEETSEMGDPVHYDLGREKWITLPCKFNTHIMNIHENILDSKLKISLSTHPWFSPLQVPWNTTALLLFTK